MSLETRLTPSQSDIQFIYQKDSRYEPFIEQGVAPSLEESSFCWLACLDMALSIYLSDPMSRLDMLSDIVAQVRAEEMLGKRGQLFIFDSFFESFVRIVAERVEKEELPLAVRITDVPVNELTYEVDVNGATVIFALQREYMSHALLMDDVVKDGDQNIVAISYLNPWKQIYGEARGTITLGQESDKEKIGGIKVNPEKIVLFPQLSVKRPQYP